MSLIPGTLVQVQGLGILLRGPAGSGKSDTALALIRAGHQLVADDAVELHRQAGRLVGRAPTQGQGLLCLRGLGMVDVVACFGTEAVARSAPVDRVVALVDEPLPATTDAHWQPTRIHGVACPRMAISPGRPLLPLLEAIAAGAGATRQPPEPLACG